MTTDVFMFRRWEGVKLIWYLLFKEPIRDFLNVVFTWAIRFSHNRAVKEMMKKQLPGVGQTKWYRLAVKIKNIKY